MAFPSFSFHLLKDLGHGADIVGHNAVGNQLVVFDDLPLRLAIILGKDLLAPEEHPLQEVVKLLTLVACGVNDPPQSGIREIAQEKDRAQDSPQFAEGEVKSIAPAVCS